MILKVRFVIYAIIFSCMFFVPLFSQETTEETSSITGETEIVSDSEETTDTEKNEEIFESLDEEVFEEETVTTEPSTSENSEPSIITIENALKTTYMQDEEKGTDTIRFEGDVQVSVEKGDSKTTIYSNFVDYDRKSNSLYAEGSVLMEQRTDGEVTERLTANSLLFDTNSLEGFFNSGRIVQEQQESLNLDDGSVLIVSSELFAKGTSNTVTFKNGNLTFCNDENPHWEIKASRIWLLPGNEFAFANALLFVGPVPVMYFPFFYYPKDELVFNPAFGYKSREGFFVQSTTYLIGRKPLGNSDSDGDDDIGFNFMQQNQLKEQELQGLILRNLDENATMPNDYLKILADYYTTLGGMVGIDGSFEPGNAISNISFNTRLGFTNVVYKIEDYPMYVSYENNQKYNDYGWFFGEKLPFRYGANFSTDIRAGDVSLSVDLPFYSDPWFNSDFDDRQESMDWIDFFLSGALTVPVDDDDDDDDNGITGFTWDVTASYKPSVTALSPWISNFSLSSLNAAVVFSTQDTPDTDFESAQIQDNSPNREFFYPSQIKPLSAKINVEGTLFEWSSEKTSEITYTNEDESSLTDEQKESLEEMTTPEYFIVEANDETENKETEEESNILESSSLPLVTTTPIETSSSATNTYALTYKISPEVSSLYSYSGTKPSSNEAISPSDFNINQPKSGEIMFKSPINVASNLSLFSSLLSIKNSFDFSPEFQDHHTLSDDYYTEEQKENEILNDYKAQQLDLENENTLSIKPFQSSELFKNTSLNWNTAVNIIETEFTGTFEEPEWDYKEAEWNDESITTHNLNAILEANQGEFYQKFSLATNLPPLVDQYSGTLTFGFPIGSITSASGYKRESEDSDEWLFLPFKQSSTWTLFDVTEDGETNPNKLTLRQSYDYDIEEETSDNLSVSLAWRGLQIAYNMKNEYNYTLDESIGWVASEEKSFSANSLAFTWNVSNFEYENEQETIEFKPGIATTLSWDMVIPTRSYFSFKPSISLDIKDFLTIKFSSESRNDQLVRYVQDVIGFTPEIPGEKNIFIDLLNSFAFFDDSKRQASGFKIESFNIELEHDLHDWILSSEFEIEPRIITDTDGSKSFDYSPYFTLAISWKPMAGIKTTIEDEYGEFTLNP